MRLSHEDYEALLQSIFELNEFDNPRLLNLLGPHYDQACRKLKRLAELVAQSRRRLTEYGLTPRERQVAEWLAVGKTNPEIATILSSSKRTIEKHMEKILEKLGVENRTAAAVMLIRCQSATNGRGRVAQRNLSAEADRTSVRRREC